MSDEIIPETTNEMEAAGEPLTMLETWMKAVTSPSEESYTKIVDDPGLSTGKAYGWITLSFGVGAILLLAGQMLFGLAFRGTTETIYELVLVIIVVVPIILVFVIVGITIMTGIATGVAKMLGGEGSFSELLYATAAYSSPIALISTILGIIPIVNFIAIPLGFYGLVLNIISVKATHRFGWGKAIGSSVSIFVGLLIIVGICGILFLAGMGGVFS